MLKKQDIQPSMENQTNLKQTFLKRAAISKLILSLSMGMMAGYFNVRGSHGLAMYFALCSTLSVTLASPSTLNEVQMKSGELLFEGLVPSVALYLLIWTGVLNVLHSVEV